MGHAARPRPRKLAEKLKKIRLDLNISQEALVRDLGLEDDIKRERISKYERGVLEPPLYILSRYAKLARVPLDVLAEDDLDLP